MTHKSRIPWPTQDGAAPEALQAMLRAAQEEHGNAAQVARLAAKLGPALALPASSPLTTGNVAQNTSTSVLTSTGTLLKGLGLISLGLLLSAALVRLHGAGGERPLSAAFGPPQATPAPEEATSLGKPEIAAAPSSLSEQQAVISRAARPVSAALMQDSPTAPRGAARRTATRLGAAEASQSVPAREAFKVDALKAEAAILHRGKADLSRNARLTWRSVEEHRKQFPNGLLAEEREILAVQSLVKLAKWNEARARLAAFERDFPGSVHASGMRAMFALEPSSER